MGIWLKYTYLLYICISQLCSDLTEGALKIMLQIVLCLSVSVPPPPSPSVREMWWEDSLNHSVQPPHPNVSEKIARQALLQHVKKHWCYGESAAKNMAITKLKYSSAFHVSRSVHITLVFLNKSHYTIMS